MEHKLIRGGEQYLAFARSRVASLKRLGQPYLSQSFNMGDAQIEVRVTPTDEFIRIDGGTPYMETGQLGWTYPGPENPTRADPARWHFLDIPFSDKDIDKYLGKVTGAGKQTNKPELSEGMESLAMGYPKVVEEEPDLAEKIAKNAATKEKYTDMLVLKKLVGNLFPPSLFSGKLRLFMQAQYGSALNPTFYQFAVELLGSSALLMYKSGSGEVLQFGLYYSNSQGIYRAPDDGSYWLISINSTGAGALKVTVYPLKLSAVTAAMMGIMKKPETSEEEKTKCEAYILAHAKIDLTKPEIVHTFTGPVGDPLAYGWKFNSNGTKATIVVHQVLGTGDVDAHDQRWSAFTVDLSISSVYDELLKKRVFAVTDQTTPHGEWTDGWGYWNIFVPTLESGGPLELKSLKTNVPGVMADFNFSVPVYGYYVDDVWEPAVMSRDLGEPADFPKLEFELTGPAQFPEGLSEDYDYRPQTGVSPATANIDFWQRIISNEVKMNLSFNGATYNGRRGNAAYREFARTVYGGYNTNDPTGFPALTVGSFFWPFPTVYPPGHPNPYDTPAPVTVTVSNIRTESRSYDAIFHDVWVLVIPSGDCEALNVTTFNFIGSVSAGVYQATEGFIVTRFMGDYLLPQTPYPPLRIPYSFEPWAQTNSNQSTGHGAPTEPVSNSVIPGPQLEYEYKVFCHNTVLSGEQGTPPNSYYMLFNVDRNYPYYDAGMYTFTSAGKRYAISEGLKSPASVNYLHRFVGWA